MRYKLSEIIVLIGGGTPKTSNTEYWDGDIPWISVKDFNNDFRYVYETEKSITKKGLDNSSTKLLQKGDVIISARGTVGEIASIPYPMAFNQSCYGLRADKDIITDDFLYYLIKYNVTILKRNTHGSVFDTITRDTFDGIEIDIPNKNNQLKIASILSKIDKKIQNNANINKNLEQQVCAIYQSWFEDFKLTNGICPEYWSYKELSTIANISSGKRPPIKSNICNQETPISIVGASSIIGFTSKSNNIDRILVTGRVGTHGIIQRLNTPCWASDNTLVIKSSYYEFTNQILNRIDFSTMNRGSTQPLITQGDIKKIVILVPDENTLKKFEEFAGSLMGQWERNNNENIKLISLRDTLLPKLMSGEIDVSNIDV